MGTPRYLPFRTLIVDPSPKIENCRRVDQIEWSNWEPVDVATLTFIVRGTEILLIRKKRGLGAGKISGPGGRLEVGESLIECAVRETEEELLVTPIAPKYRGELRFQFLDRYSIHTHVFTSVDFTGVPTETDEAIPLWTAIDGLPYNEMWEDDPLWLPRILKGQSVSGYFLFDGDTMLDYEIETPALQARESDPGA